MRIKIIFVLLLLSNLLKANNDTLFIKLDNDTVSHKVDTIFISSIPNFVVFESVENTTLKVVLACYQRPVELISSEHNRLVFPTRNVRWETDRFVVGINHTQDTLLRVLYVYTDSIFNLMLKNKTIQVEKEQKRVADSIKHLNTVQEKINNYENNFQKIKQLNHSFSKKELKKIEKLYRKSIPSSSIKVNDSLYYDETEVTNIAWLNYLYHLYKDSAESIYTQAKPDTTVWYDNNKTYRTAYIDHYLRYPGFRYFPVVGMSYEQAYEYCIWRTNMENYKLRLKYSKFEYEIIIHYRLPTPEEFVAVAQNEIADKSIRSVYQHLSSQRPQHQMTDAVKAAPLNRKGLYGIYGNVAEMTSHKGVAKGGSFHHKITECLYENTQTYQSPQCWLGFRCVAEIIILKKARSK